MARSWAKTVWSRSWVLLDTPTAKLRSSDVPTLCYLFFFSVTFRKWFEFLASSNLWRSGRSSSGNFDIDTDKPITCPSSALEKCARNVVSLGEPTSNMNFQFLVNFNHHFLLRVGKKKKRLTTTKPLKRKLCVHTQSFFQTVSAHECTWSDSINRIMFKKCRQLFSGSSHRETLFSSWRVYLLTVTGAVGAIVRSIDQQAS